VRLIEERTEKEVQKGEPARITCKMNALTDPRIIESFYEASQAGVRKDLIRGICCLRPGLQGISENIRVVSLVGRFPEHARAFAFGEDEEKEIYLGSADDLMQRNLDRRVEQLFPLRAARRRDKVRRLLKLELTDTVNA
jgi:polyphosphate kinase